MSLVPVDEDRLPIVVDHNDDISCLAIAVIVAASRPDDPRAIVTIKTLLETAFYLGFKAGENNVQLDREVWG